MMDPKTPAPAVTGDVSDDALIAAAIDAGGIGNEPPEGDEPAPAEPKTNPGGKPAKKTPEGDPPSEDVPVEEGEPAPEGDAPTDEPAADEPAPQADAAKAARMDRLKRIQEQIKVREAVHRAHPDFERREAEVARAREQILKQHQDLLAQQARVQRILEDPIRGLREAGHDPERVIRDIASDGSPEAAFRREMAELRRLMTEQQQAHEAFKQQAQAERQAREQRERETEHRNFVSRATEIAPNTRLLYRSDKALVAEGYRIVNEWAAQGIDPNTVSNDDILEHLEQESSARVAEIRNRQSGDPKPAAQPRQVNTSNPLSAKKTSERRSIPVDWHSLSEAEQDRELLRVAREAGRKAS